MQLGKRKIQPKYTIGGLLFLLAFCFYIAFVPNKNRHLPEHQDRNEERREHKRSDKDSLRYLTVFQGKVIGIKDGDTFEVLYDGQPEKVRLADIDCPEKSQAFGKNAKQYASDLCFGKTVTVTSTGKRDRYKRIIGTITTNDSVNVNQELIKAGYAWHYKRYSKNDELSSLEKKAREAHIGLWADANPKAPWEWRKERRKSSNQ